jgi:DNA repair protein RAD50
LKGRLEEVDSQIRDVDAKLNNATYRNIGERHRRKNIEFETTLMAVSDLDAYYNALDGALAQYHMMKIREINKIIRELWQQVYRGDDIDRIEISSDQDVDTSGGTAKRSYNYRVVMTKGTIPLDMRGRCSAGQRVLAGTSYSSMLLF